MKTIKITYCLLFSVFLLWSCEEPESLEPVAGMEGKLFIDGEWPDSIKATALIVLKTLDPNNLEVVTYSTPMLSPETESEYFFQLEPGFYFIAGAGLTIEPTIFFAKIDSFRAAGDLPIVLLDKEPHFQRVITLGEQEVLEIDQTILFSQ
ncbi:MAG: hypothetical protein ISR82_05785 [Candidatus Marinimicrobia bacterium]|nr:hypothetical protein [Candidatus Neomarinimicrobiota bacterium]MBL7010714.1 hypothetical protein [Candidatus Neomarinimicrobiota bacterium]MBL7029881.1 hypothetical protein [Candidatus Neomarinimicrobiota bacterium]